MAQAPYNQQAKLALSDDFIKRVKIAAIKAALAIASEATNTAFHVKRRAFGNQVLMNAQANAELLAHAIACDGGIAGDGGTATKIVVNGTTGEVTTTATDQNIADAVSAVWNAFAVADDTP